MANGPKIKVEADLSSFETSLNNLKSTIAQMGEELKSASGKASLNFDGPERQLKAIIAVADKLTAALDKVDKSSASHAKNAKATAAAMADAAKLSSRIETQGGASNRNTSNYFRTYSNELNQESNDSSAANAVQSSRDRVQQRLEHDREIASSRTTNRIGGMAGTAIGAITSGGGIYGSLGANIGGMAGGPIGLIAGQILGGIGGVIDSNLSKVRDEQKAYSEIFRMIGTTSHDFTSLQNSVRAATSGLTITAIEAGNLAKNYVKLTGSDDQDLIARTVRTAASVSQSFGIGNEKTAELAGNAKLYGQVNNSADLRRIMLQVAESTQKGGGRLEEVLTSLSGMIQRAATTTFTSQDIGSYASLLASGSSLPYAGIKNNPGGVAALINQASSTASAGGGAGDASQEFINRALHEAYPGVDPRFYRSMQGAGIHDDLGKIFAKDGLLYSQQKTDAEKEEMLRAKDSIDNSGFKTLDSAYRDRVERTGGGSMQNLSVMGRLYGMSPSQAAIMMQLSPEDTDHLEKKLTGMGIDGDTQTKYAGQFSELFVKGNSKEYFDNLVKNGRLSKEDQATGDKLFKSDKDGFEKFIYSQIPKQPVDVGLGAQLSDYELQKKISESITSLVTIGTESQKAIIGILDFFTQSDSATNAKMDKLQNDNPLSGKSAAGGDFETKGALGLGNKTRLNYFNDQIRSILKAKPGDKKALYDDLYKTIKESPEQFPAEAYKMADDALKQGVEKDGAVNQGPLPADTSVSSIPLRDGGTGDYGQRLVAAIMKRNPNMSRLDAEAIVGNAEHETGHWKVFNNPNSGDKPGHDTLGVIGAFHWRGKRNKDFSDSLNGRSPDDVDANADYFSKEYNSEYYAKTRDAVMGAPSLADKTIAFERGYEGSKNNSADGRRIKNANRLHEMGDQLPPEHIQQAQKNQALQPVSFNGNFTLSDTQGRQVAPSINVSRLSRPRAYSA